MSRDQVTDHTGLKHDKTLTTAGAPGTLEVAGWRLAGVLCCLRGGDHARATGAWCIRAATLCPPVYRLHSRWPTDTSLARDARHTRAHGPSKGGTVDA